MRLYRTASARVRLQSAAIYRDTLLIKDGTHYSRWDLKSGKKLEECLHQSTLFDVSADGRRLVVGWNRRWLVLDDGLAALRDNANCWGVSWHLRFLPDGRLMAQDGGYLTDSALPSPIDSSLRGFRAATYSGSSRATHSQSG